MSSRKNVKPKKKKSPNMRKEAANEMVDSNDMQTVMSKLNKIDKKIPDISLGNVGRKVGERFGLGDLGAKAGSTLASIFGMGDYEISGNSIMSGNVNSQQAVNPSFKSVKNQIRIREREFLGNVVASSTINGFLNKQYPIQPQNPNTFPWLSTIAQLYDQWEPHGVVFEFVSTASEYASNGSIGIVIMATDYNAFDTAYPNKIVMENAEFSCASKISSTLLHGVECDPKQRPISIMYTNPLASTQNFTTLGNFQIATSGVPYADIVVGELWVSYDISFYKKALTTNLGIQLNGSATGVSSGSGVGFLSGDFVSTAFPSALAAPTQTTAGAVSTLTFPQKLGKQQAIKVDLMLTLGSNILLSDASTLVTYASNCTINIVATTNPWYYRALSGVGGLTAYIRLINTSGADIVPTLSLTRTDSASAISVSALVSFSYVGFLTQTYANNFSSLPPLLSSPVSGEEEDEDYEPVVKRPPGFLQNYFAGTSFPA